MTIETHQRWLRDFYSEHGWYQLSSAVRLNFLTEEVGELSRAIRTLEIGRDHPGEAATSLAVNQDNLEEELADVLDQVLVLADKYQLTGSELLKYSEAKIQRRFHLNEK